MNYKVLSRSTCEKYSLQKHSSTSVIISIRSSWDKVLPNLSCNDTNNIKDILSLAFDDTDLDEAIKFNDFVTGYITDEQATQIFEFCKKWYNKVDTYIFHCDGGISRSAGCCGAIMRWFEGYDYPIMGKKSKYPNMYCYNKVLDACRQISNVPITNILSKIVDDPYTCKHFSAENSKKNGKPCKLYDICKPFSYKCICNAYEEENLDELINNLPDD